MPSKEEIPVLQLVNQFAVGGAESQFVARLRGHPKGFRPVVACVNKAGPHLVDVQRLGPEAWGAGPGYLSRKTAEAASK